MGSESAAHVRLVGDLAGLLERAGCTLTGLDLPGCRRPKTYGGHRPDVSGGHPAFDVRLLGEAKLGPELFARWTLDQLAAFSHTLAPDFPPGRVHFVLAVPAGYTSLAWRALMLAGAPHVSTIVAARLRQGWLLSFLAEPGPAGWRGRRVR